MELLGKFFDHLDLLREYMYYWIEFKDNERILLENVKKEMDSFLDDPFIKSVGEIEMNVVRKKPYEFHNILATFGDVKKHVGNEKAKEMLINSLRKFQNNDIIKATD